MEGFAEAKHKVRGSISKLDVITLSAYAIAVQHGFEGTEEDWLASLKGDSGDGSGDMLVATYDPQKKRRDIFKYIDDKIDAVAPMDVSEHIALHNEDDNAHADIREEVSAANKTADEANETAEIAQATAAKAQEAATNEDLVKLVGDKLQTIGGNTVKVGGGVGDVRISVRTDLGDDYALCNGENFFCTDETQREFFDMLPHGIMPRKVDDPFNAYDPEITTYYHRRVRQSLSGWWICRSSATIGATAWYLLHPVTGEMKCVTAPGSTIGIDWDGDRWVACTLSSGSLGFYYSGDLVTWTFQKSVRPNESPGTSSGYGDVWCMFDGVSFRVMCQEDGYQANYLHTIPKDLSSCHCERRDNHTMFCTDGLFCVCSNYQVYAYLPGETTAKFSAWQNAESATYTHFSAFNKYADGKYVLAPSSGVNWTDLYFYNSGDSNKTTVSARTILGSSYACYLLHTTFDRDTNELVFMIKENSDPVKHHLVRLPADADPTVVSNYTVSASYGANPPIVFGGTPVLTMDWDYIYTSSSVPEGCNASGFSLRRLPALAVENAYAYIKVAEGG